MKNLLIVSILSLAVLTACSTFVGEKYLHIQKGKTPTEVMAVDRDLVEPGLVSIKGDGLNARSEYAMLISEMRASNNDNYIIYAFKDNKLIYWGYPYQFLRHDDKELRVFGDIATKYLVSKQYLKETKQ